MPTFEGLATLRVMVVSYLDLGKLKGNCHGKKVSLFIAFSGCSRSTSIPKKKLVPQVEIPGSYGQLQNHNLELPVVGGTYQ